MIITRLSLLLLTVALLTVMLAGTPQSVTSASAIAPCSYAPAALMEKYPVIAPHQVSDSETFKGSLSGRGSQEEAQVLANIAGAGVEDDTLRMYYDLSALSLKKRRVVFRNAIPALKSVLWKIHLALFLVKASDLSEWQKAVILSAIDMATPEYFGVGASDPAWKEKVKEPSLLLEQQIFSAFSIQDAAKIFATLGDDTESVNSTAPVLLKNMNYKPISVSKLGSSIRFIAQDMELEGRTCGCSTNSDYCPVWSACGGGGCPITSGCGTFWSYPCNGACR